MPPDDRSLNILAIEPYYGGSHRAFIDGWAAAGRHRFTLITLPARKWKWRMRGAAIWAVDQLATLPESARFDLIFVSDMLSVADLVALLPQRFARLPIICYFHENQLTYPLSPNDRRDYQYGLTNITSCLAADEVWFNSEYHRQSFVEAAGQLLKQMPDCVPVAVPQRIRDRSRIMHPGVDLTGLKPNTPQRVNDPPILLWNHRWEFDKNPDAFFAALEVLAERKISFCLMVLGEAFRASPPVFEQARNRFADQVLEFGFLESRADYLTALNSADFVVSTAIHEFFGLSTVEAVAGGCRPVLPRRLSYPELIPDEMHDAVFYDSDESLADKLARLIADPTPDSIRPNLADHVRRFAWTIRAPEFDAAAVRTAAKAASSRPL